MANVPTRLLVLQTLQAHLQALPTVNDLSVDMTQRVLRGRIIIGADTKPAPYLLSLVEAPAPDTGSMFSGDYHDMRRDWWPLLLQGVALDDKTSSTDDGYHLAAAVEAHLAQIVQTRRDNGEPAHPDVFMLGGLINELEIGRATVRPPEAGVSAYTFFILPLKVGISATVDQPYTVV